MPESAPPDGPLKLVILPRTRAGLGREGLRQHLEQVHGPLVMSEPDVSGCFASYVHHYVRDEGPAPFGERLLAGRDAITIIRFADASKVADSKGSLAYREKVGPDEDNFREIEGSVALAAQEVVVKPDDERAARKVFAWHAGAAPDAGELADRAQSLAPLAAIDGVAGLTINAVRVLEGDFRFGVCDEIALLPHADTGRIAATWRALANAGATQILITEPVTFISAKQG